MYSTAKVVSKTPTNEFYKIRGAAHTRSNGPARSNLISAPAPPLPLSALLQEMRGQRPSPLGNESVIPPQGWLGAGKRPAGRSHKTPLNGVRIQGLALRSFRAQHVRGKQSSYIAMCTQWPLAHLHAPGFLEFGNWVHVLELSVFNVRGRVRWVGSVWLPVADAGEALNGTLVAGSSRKHGDYASKGKSCNHTANNGVRFSHLGQCLVHGHVPASGIERPTDGTTS